MPDARDPRGQMLIVMVFLTTTLMAITALSIDAAFMFDKRAKLYAAADAAAQSAALEAHRGNTGNLVAQASEFVRLHGFTPVGCGVGGGVAVCVTNPYGGNPNAVEVILSE